MTNASDMPEILETVARRPSMYGLRSLGDFITFVRGWNLGRQEQGGADFFDGFQEWSASKFGQPPANAWSYFVIEELGDDAGKIDEFMQLIADFKSQAADAGTRILR